MNLQGLERLDAIRHRLDTNGTVLISELADELEVSEMTIRRDLDILVDEGSANRVRGGAMAIGPQRFETRSSQNARAKGIISKKLATLVGTGGVIGLDASSTLQRLATQLGNARDLTVLTNGPETFASLQQHPGVTALLTGGQLNTETGSLVGPLARRVIDDLLLRRLFISGAALDSEIGTSEATLSEAEVKVALADVAQEVVLAVDSTKLDRRASARCLPPDRIGILVTELDPDDPRLDQYRESSEIL